MNINIEECVDTKAKIIYWNNIPKLLEEAKEIYQKGMKIAKKEYDFEIEDTCKIIRDRYKSIQEHSVRRDFIKRIDIVIMDILSIYCNVLACEFLIKKYEN